MISFPTSTSLSSELSCGPLDKHCAALHHSRTVDAEAYPMLPGALISQPANIPGFPMLTALLPRDVKEAFLPLSHGIEPPIPISLPNLSTTLAASLNASLQLAVAGLSVEETVSVSANVTVGTRRVPKAANATFQVPCGDSRGCPDLLVDPARLLIGQTTWASFSPSSCSVIEGSTEPGLRRLLRFTFTTPNLGEGDLVIGSPEEHPEWFIWGECHKHHHFREYADYRLWKIQGYVAWQEARARDPEGTPESLFSSNPELLDGFVSGHKQGFCAVDVVPYVLLEPSKYHGCSRDQGISRWWADEYGFVLEGQWVDVTDVPSGIYVLEAEVNPERLYKELDYSNNAGAILVVIP